MEGGVLSVIREELLKHKEKTEITQRYSKKSSKNMAKMYIYNINIYIYVYVYGQPAGRPVGRSVGQSVGRSRGAWRRGEGRVAARRREWGR